MHMQTHLITFQNSKDKENILKDLEFTIMELEFDSLVAILNKREE